MPDWRENNGKNDNRYGCPEIDQFIPDVVDGSETHTDSIQKKSYGHCLGEGNTKPVEGGDNDESRSHSGDCEHRGKDKNEYRGNGQSHHGL
jgi:hypothetical protein